MQLDEARRKRAKPKQPHTPKAKTNKATEEETTATTKSQQKPATPRRHNKGSTQTKKHRTQRDNQSRPKQITGRKIRAPAHHPEKDNGQGRHQGDIRPTSHPQRQEAKRDTTTKRNELRSTSAPAQSADRHTSTKRGQDLGCAAVEPKQKYECTCPVCGHAHKHARKCKRDQDLSSAVVETRNNSSAVVETRNKKGGR